MSKKNIKPGANLGTLLDLVTKLELSVESQAENNTRPGGAEEIEGILNRLAEVAITPDQVKFLNDRFLGSAEAHQQKSDEYGHVALMLEHCATTMETRLIQAMAAKKIEELDGDTWKATLMKMKPIVRIDAKKLKEEAPEFLHKVETLDEKKFDSAVAAGIEIPGVIVEPQYALEFSVIKKVQD